MPDYAKSVFINCPFDEKFEPLFHAITLTVLALQFEPRCAREYEGSAEPRISRIAKGLQSSKYSIHDLSRYQGEGEKNLARFNMPLELGIALGLRFERANGAMPHNWTALVLKGSEYERFVSDLAGYDQPDHEQTENSVVAAVAGWLRLQPDFVAPAPSAKAIAGTLPGFRDLIAQAKADAGGRLSWPDILECAMRTLKNLDGA